METPASVTQFGPADFARTLAAEETLAGAAWFGPGAQLRPIAPTEVAGRNKDFQFGYNKLVQPKQGDNALAFPLQLRALSEGWEILRAVIETRKDQGCRIPLQFRDRDWKPGKADSAAVQKARALFRKPDGFHSLATWRRMIREDLYVLDAPTVYVSKIGGKATAFEVIDGATIKVLQDKWGRAPLPPHAAYQQVLKGVPAVQYTTDEIIYAPRNARAHKIYGFSPVEQMLLVIDTAIRRAVGQNKHFSEGNIPEMFIACPDTWNPDQVREMQDYWDAIMSGNIGAKQGARFIPGGMKPETIKGDALLKNEFDEWLVRQVCYFFSVSPSAFIRDMNRATAQTNADAAAADGVLSELVWEKDLFDDMLERAGLGEVEAIHNTTKDPDPKTHSEIVLAHLAAGLIGKSKAREVLGYSEDDAPDESAAPVAEPAKDEDTTEAKGAGKADHGHGCGCDAHKADDTPLMDSEAPFVEAIQGLLAKYAAKAEAQAQAIYSGAKVPEIDLAKADFKAFVKLATVELGDAAVLALSEAQKLAPSRVDLSLLEAPARDYAATKAAEMVGMRWDGRKLIPNPDAAWRISDEVREAVRRTITRAFEERMTSSDLSTALSQDYAFSPRRSLTIARTEIAGAQEAASVRYFKAAGVAKKRWSGAANCCPACQALEAKGPIGMDEEFAPGIQHGPLHPNDRCRVLPVLEEKV